MRCQKIKQFQFLRRKIKCFSAISRGIIVNTNGKILVRRFFFRVRSSLVSSQYRPCPCYELFRLKRLNYVIIRAKLQAQHLIKHFSFGSQHNYWCIAQFTNLTAYFPAIHPRQHYVEHHDMVLMFLKSVQSFQSIQRMLNTITFLLKIYLYKLPYIGIIIYNQYLIILQCNHDYLLL